MTVKLHIKGMTCSHCVQTVAKTLGAVAGVTRVTDVNPSNGEAVVDGAPEPAELIAALRDQGFEAVTA